MLISTVQQKGAAQARPSWPHGPRRTALHPDSDSSHPLAAGFLHARFAAPVAGPLSAATNQPLLGPLPHTAQASVGGLGASRRRHTIRRAAACQSNLCKRIAIVSFHLSLFTCNNDRPPSLPLRQGLVGLRHWLAVFLPTRNQRYLIVRQCDVGAVCHCATHSQSLCSPCCSKSNASLATALSTNRRPNFTATHLIQPPRETSILPPRRRRRLVFKRPLESTNCTTRLHPHETEWP